MESKVSPELDALRGASAIVVAVAHYIQIWVAPSFSYSSLTSEISGLAATYAVVVFFVLSGFMIALSMVRHCDSVGRLHSLEFFKARFFRLIPPYYFAVVFSIAIVSLIQVFGLYGSVSYRLPADLDIAREVAFVNKRDIIWSVLLFYGVLDGVGRSLYFDGPLWSLSIEWWLYILAVVGGHAWTNRSGYMGGVFLVAIALLVVAGDSAFIMFGTVWLIAFGAGLAYSRGARLDTMACWSIVAISLVVAAALTFHDLWKMLLDRSPATIIGGGIAITAIVVWRADTASSESGFATLLAPSANWSYTLYLVHFPILLLGFSLTRLLVHPYGWAAECATGFFWLVAAIVFSIMFAPVIENRRAIRDWFEKMIPVLAR